MNVDTLEAIRRSAAIPSMPLVAARCFEITKDPHCNFDRLVELLGTDPGIAADVLRMSNSALFGITRQVASLKQAITLLGLGRVRDLVLSRYLVRGIDRVATQLIDFDYFWRRSVTTAILSSKFADTLAPRQRDEAFIGGLLADAGVVILAFSLPTQYAAIAACYRPPETGDWRHAEFKLLEMTHGEVSALILEQWNFPPSLVEAVKHHHSRPAEMTDSAQGRVLAQIIGGAGEIARILCEAVDPESAIRSCQACMERVELDIVVLVKSLEGIESQIRGMARSLGLEVINNRLFGLIAERLVSQLTSNCAP
jgi:HD-like signal output (HDOD) protein